jgi:hypothetical protein
MSLPAAEQMLLSGERALVEDPLVVEGYKWRDVQVTTAATGGAPITSDELARLRSELTDLARRFGYPIPQKKGVLTSFDRDCARFLSGVDMHPGEGLRAETWAWIAVALVPHVVLWRWPFSNGKITLERFAGHLVRNQFGRIWYAQHALVGAGDPVAAWKAHDSLGSDQLVGLFERPALGASPIVAKAIADAWSQRTRQPGDRFLFRTAMKLLILRAAIQRLDLIDYGELVRVAKASFGSVIVPEEARDREEATEEDEDEE